MSIVNGHMLQVNFVFFGTDEYSAIVLGELENNGFLPALIVTTPDRPKGRGLKLFPSPVKEWAMARNIAVITPERLGEANNCQLPAKSFDLFIVASYGKIIPGDILNIPTYGALNVHPSLLPCWRGASPVQAQILAGDERFGVSVMLLDEKMDHGPVLAQETLPGNHGSKTAEDIYPLLFSRGGALLVRTLSKFLVGKVTPLPQNDRAATFSKPIRKENGLITPSDDPVQNYRKFRAYAGWPGVYFLAEKNGKKVRVSIKKAAYTDGRFVMLRVVPEGKKEMSYEEFLRGFDVAR